MRSRPLCVALVSVLVALSAPGMATAATKHKHKKKGPTLQQQIKADVAKAERSPDLWATVNVCTSSTAVPPGDVVGIRGQMPALGIAATLSMAFSVAYWNYTTNAFQTVTATSKIALGTLTHGLHQGGVNFPFSPPTPPNTYLVRGTITFTWQIGNKVVGSVTRNTGHGYANVGFSNPPGTSEGTCTLM